jgi:hypothetical protein
VAETHMAIGISAQLSAGAPGKCGDGEKTTEQANTIGIRPTS